MSRIQIQFEWGRDLDEAVSDIREQMDFAREVLPEDATDPTVFKFNLSDMPVGFLGVGGGGDVRRLRRLAEETLSRRLERVPGVASVDVRGGREREIQVRLDQARLAALGVSPGEVTRALSRENRNVSAGDMLETGREVMIRTVGEFESTEEIANVVVTTRDGRPLQVKDLGEVRDTFREITNELWIDGEPGMRMYVSKQSGANTVEVMADVRDEIDNLNREFAGRAEISILMDSSEFISQSVNNVRRGALMGAALAVIVLLIFLRDLRATLIIGTAIPISVLATFALMYFYGFTLNVISLGGIALGIGMLVDSSIVVLENIHRMRRQGASALSAAISGTREVSTAILAGTMTTIAVFIPVVFIAGFAGIFFKEMAIVVSFALFCSLTVSLDPDPVARSEVSGQQPRRSRPVWGPTPNHGDLARPRPLVRRHPETAAATPLASRRGCRGLLVLSFFLTSQIGFELMPESDEGQLGVHVELPIGTPVETTAATMKELELRLRGALQDGELEHLVSTAGPENWWRPAAGNQGSMEVMLTPVSERTRGQDVIVSEVRRAMSDLPGAEVKVYASSGNMMMRMMRGGGERLTVEVRGHDLDTADALAERVRLAMLDVPGVVHPRVDRERGQLERTLHVDRERLAELGMAGADVAESVEHYVLGKVATRFREGGEEYDVRIQLAEEQRSDLEQLPQLPIVTPGGQVIRLGALAGIEPSMGPTSIAREDQQRILRISAGISDRGFGEVVGELQERLALIEVPEGFAVSLGVSCASREKCSRSC